MINCSVAISSLICNSDYVKDNENVLYTSSLPFAKIICIIKTNEGSSSDISSHITFI